MADNTQDYETLSAKEKARIDHNNWTSEWRSKNTKSKSVVFDMRKPTDLAMYQHVTSQPNATAYIKSLVMKDMEAKGLLGDD